MTTMQDRWASTVAMHSIPGAYAEFVKVYETTGTPNWLSVRSWQCYVHHLPSGSALPGLTASLRTTPRSNSCPPTRHASRTSHLYG